MEGDRHNRREIGKQGEDIACRLLTDKGHIILERNWRSGHLEIDIITCNPDGIHFVEVKTRKSNIQAPPQDNVDMGKQMRTARAAKGYLRKTRDRRLRNMECIFDVVAVTFSEDGVQTEFIEQAFIPLYI